MGRRLLFFIAAALFGVLCWVLPAGAQVEGAAAGGGDSSYLTTLGLVFSFVLFNISLLLLVLLNQRLQTTVKRRTRKLEAANEQLSQSLEEQQRTTQALHASDTRFRMAMDNAPIGMVIASTEGQFLQVNKAMCAITGYSEDDLLQMNFQAITHPDDLQKDLDKVQQMLNREISTFDLEKRYIHKDGQTIWIHLYASTIADKFGNPQYFIGQIQDITEERATAISLKQSNERLHLALQAANMGAWEWDFETATIEYDEYLYRLLKLDSGQTRVPSTWLTHFLYPEDVQRVRQEFF